MSILHSVRLDESLCRGCTNCLKTCPTEAIRVKSGKAYIIEERCVDCGACIRRCPFRAKKAYSDSLSVIEKFDFAIALPAPALYGQFPKGTTVNAILEGLRRLGFDECVEVALAAEAVSRATQAYRASHRNLEPLISSSCPAVVRLLRNRFPDFLNQVIPLRSPMELAARMARHRYEQEGRKLGVFFISPCAAKVTAVRDPLGDSESAVDGVIGINEIWLELREEVLAVLGEAEAGNPPPQRSEAGFRGISWARAEGEAESAGLGETLAADGIGAVLEVLEALEDNRLEGIGFLELMACPGGCVGGPLAVENPYLARSRIRGLEEEGRIADQNSAAPEQLPFPDWRYDSVSGDISLSFDSKIHPLPIFPLSPDYPTAVEMMKKMDELEGRLPGLDCGSCGSPSCRALAEDIVRGFAKETDCIFRLRDRVHDLTLEMLKLEEIQPPGLDRQKQ